MDGSGRNVLGRFLGGKASPSSFSVTIASRVWRLLSKNAVNREFLRFSKSMKYWQVLATKRLWICYKKSVLGELALSIVGVEEGRKFRFRGDLYSQESTFPLVMLGFCRLEDRKSIWPVKKLFSLSSSGSLGACPLPILELLWNRRPVKQKMFELSVRD